MERQARRRRRPALSCLECRRRKIKCDRSDPCAHCVSSRIQCTYRVYNHEPGTREHQPARASSWGAPPSPSVQPNSPQAQAQAQASDTSGVRPVTEPPNAQFGLRTLVAAERNHATPNTPGRSNTAQPSHDPEEESDLRDPLKRIRRPENSSASNNINPLSNSPQDVLARQSGLQDSQVVLKKTRLWRWSDWMGEAREFETVFAWYITFIEAGDGKECKLQDPETRALAVQTGTLLKSCKKLARTLKMGRPSRSLSIPAFNLVPPSREAADAMVNRYLDTFESTYRIIHIPTFWVEYQTFWDQPESVSANMRLKILLVIGLGSSLQVHGDTDVGFRSTVHQWVYAAQHWLSGPLEKDRLGVTGLQVHCLTILARQVFSVGGDLVWMSMGSLIHTAMQIGLHRDPKHFPAMSVLQAEMRRRLWATILEMVVQSSLDSAMPPRISFDEFDTEAPSNVNDNEIDETTTPIQPHPKGTYTDTSLQLVLLESIPTRLRVLRLLNGLHSELSYADVLTLSSELTDAYRKNIAFTKENRSFGVTPFHRNLVDFSLRRFMIPLHCPFASKARTNPLFHYSIKASLDAAMAIISPEADETFSRLMAVAGGMFKEGFRYATGAISLEFIALAEAQQLDGTLHRNIGYREVLRKAMDSMIERSAERTRQGETNIKGHMFLSMIVAQIEAMEAGVPGAGAGDHMIAQRAKDSLEFCYALLQKQAENAPSPWSTDTALATTLDGGQGGAFALDWDLDFFLPDADFSA